MMQGVVCMKGGRANSYAPKNAARKLFGLNLNEFLFLFTPEDVAYFNSSGKMDWYNTNVKKFWSPSINATPKEVAKHIRTFVNMGYK